MSDVAFVKYCPTCGAANPRRQAFCLHCTDGDLTTVPAERQRANSPIPPSVAGQPTATATSESRCDGSTRRIDPHPACILELIGNPQQRFTIHEGQTVGRTEKSDIVLAGVPKLDCVSSIHARFFRRGEQWYVQHLGHTNFIKVDGELFCGAEEVPIHDGTTLILTLTPFRIILPD